MYIHTHLSPTDYVLDSLVVTRQLEEDKREMVRAALLLRHKHQNSRDHENKFMHNIRSMAEIGRCVCVCVCVWYWVQVLYSLCCVQSDTNVSMTPR